MISIFPYMVEQKIKKEVISIRFMLQRYYSQTYPSQVTYLEPGQASEIEGKNGSKARVQATVGPILGPPWQRPENG